MSILGGAVGIREASSALGSLGGLETPPPARRLVCTRQGNIAAAAADPLHALFRPGVCREPATYKSVDDIIQDRVIVENLEKTKEAAKDPARIRDILAAAKDRSFLTNHKPGQLVGWLGVD